MSSQSARQFASRQYPCEKCPLRPLPAFREFDKQELSFISTFKRGELAVDKGATVLVEGRPLATATSTCTVCAGAPGTLAATGTTVLVG